MRDRSPAQRQWTQGSLALNFFGFLVEILPNQLILSP